MQKLYLHSFLFTIVIILFTSSFLKAQDIEAAAKPINGEIRHWSMDLKWMRNFDLGKQRIGSVNISPTETEDLKGLGVTWFLNPNWSIGTILSLNLGSSTSEDQTGKQESSLTEIGTRFTALWYPKGYNGYTWYAFGIYAGYSTFSDEITFTPASGDATTTKFSGSKWQAGLRAEVGLRPSENADVEFFTGFNLGGEGTPSYKYTPPSGDEVEGPSSTYFSNCGADVGFRWFFNREINY